MGLGRVRTLLVLACELYGDVPRPYKKGDSMLVKVKPISKSKCTVTCPKCEFETKKDYPIEDFTNFICYACGYKLALFKRKK